MKTNVIIGGVLINVLLIIGIVYLHYYAPTGSQLTPGSPTTERAVSARIAIIIPTEARNTVREVLAGVTDTLQRTARFEPEIKIYNANDSRSVLRSNIEAAINSDPDVLVTLSSQAAQMARELTAKREMPVPMVFCMVGDPLRLELVHSLHCSGNNLTGVGIVGFEWIDNMVNLIPVVAPWVKTVFIPYDPTGFGGVLVEYKERFFKALERKGYQVKGVELNHANEMSTKVTPFMDGTDLVIVLPDATVTDGISQLSKLCEQYGCAMYAALSLGLLQKGATFAYGYHTYDIGVQAAKLVRQIVEQNKQPTSIPVDQMADGYRVGVNVDNARKQGVLDKIDESVVFLMENGEVI